VPVRTAYAGHPMADRAQSRGPAPAEATWSGADELKYLELAFAKVPMFSACTSEELIRVAAATTILEVPAGQVVIREGDAGHDFFVILRGDAQVARGGTDVATLGVGDFFGELALFDPAPRNATVTARTTLTVAVLSQPGFQAVLAERTVRDHIFLGMARRLHQLDSRV
jgi:CRP/FNR family transcriptional regulator, cyclic AMP receptor protein